jgi:hypothetical protein
MLDDVPPHPQYVFMASSLSSTTSSVQAETLSYLPSLLPCLYGVVLTHTATSFTFINGHPNEGGLQKLNAFQYLITYSTLGPQNRTFAKRC